MEEEWNDEELVEKIFVDNPPYNIEELTKEEILSDMVMDYLVSIKNPVDRIRQFEKVKDKAKELKVASSFKTIYKQKDDAIGIKNLEEKSSIGITFPNMNNITYNTTRYEIDESGAIYENVYKVGKILVCYHPILPLEIYTNLEDGSEKIKIAFYKRGNWKNIIVDKSIISNSQSIIKLSDFGIEVNSENAKFLIRYLAEICNLNEDKIKINTSVSRLGWAKDVLIPYSDKFEFDNEKEFPNMKEKFGESGKLEEWIEFFKERRKHSSISRIVMAASVASILLKDIKQNGFTVHIWGESEYGKTVACMVGQSIFGNPSQNDNKGIGINFNFTNAGLEYRLNLYNNIPLFINEMQHQKDAKDYDKILFLISEGTGKSRSTKNGGIGKENSWNNIVITNGEKNIIKDNSNAGAYNRCISCEITEYSYENLSEVADFVKENYGTPIREILKHLNEYNCKQIYKNILDSLENQDITNKQKILEAIILLGDKILTDIIFKDEFYLTQKDFENKTIKKKEVAVEERAFEIVRDWYVSEKRHFLSEEGDAVSNQELKVEIYGREMKYGYLAIIPSVLKKTLEENSYDFNEVINAWKRKDYIKHEKNRNTLTVIINNSKTKCIVLDMKKDIEDESETTEEDLLPF